MPMYDYVCNACGFADSELVAYSEGKTKTCPQCRKRTYQRQLTTPSIHLKGAGFYNTDYKPQPKDPQSEAASAGDKTAESSAGAKGGADKTKTDKNTAKEKTTQEKN